MAALFLLLSNHSHFNPVSWLMSSQSLGRLASRLSSHNRCESHLDCSDHFPSINQQQSPRPSFSQKEELRILCRACRSGLSFCNRKLGWMRSWLPITGDSLHQGIKESMSVIVPPPECQVMSKVFFPDPGNISTKQKHARGEESQVTEPWRQNFSQQDPPVVIPMHI